MLLILLVYVNQLWNHIYIQIAAYVTPLYKYKYKRWYHSWLITGFVTRLIRRVSLVEQKLLTLAEHLSSSPVFSGIRVTRSLVFFYMYVLLIVVWPFVLFPLAIVLSIPLRYKDSDYPFGIFKLLLQVLSQVAPIITH